MTKLYETMLLFIKEYFENGTLFGIVNEN